MLIWILFGFLWVAGLLACCLWLAMIDWCVCLRVIVVMVGFLLVVLDCVCCCLGWGCVGFAVGHLLLV